VSAPNTTNLTPERTSRAASSRGGLLARHPLISFFLLTFALTWLGWSPWFLSRDGVGLLPYDGGGYSDFINTVGLVLGPTLSAFVVTGASEGREGVRRLLRRIVQWRVKLRWYALALLGIPAVVLLSAAVMPGALASFDAAAVPSALVKYVVVGFIYLFIGGPVFEEIGWRGFALPRLQPLYGPLAGSVVLGVLWGLWHLPLFLIPSWDTPHGSPMDVALFVILAVANAIVYTWVFNNTKGSVLLAILLHGSANISIATAFDLFPVPAVTEGFANFVIGFAALALVILVLTRGRLGYRQEDVDAA
jgi:membrane protease YdiL (CAAX protease family)